MSTTTDPFILNAAIAEATKPEVVEVKTIAPASTDVTLPGGFIFQDGVLSKYAEVRELNGADEEAISKAKSLSQAFTIILKRGLVSVGGRDLEKTTYDNLLSGDVEAIILGIRRATFGDIAEYQLTCPKCEKTSVVDIDLNTDIPTNSLDNPISDRTWKVSIKTGVATLTLPTGRVQTMLLENSDKTNAELNTLLLGECLIGIDGKGTMGASTALKLGIEDRNKLIEEINEKNSGPRFGEVSKACEACGEVISTPVSLIALFRL